MSGYNRDFVDNPPDRLCCKICQFPCRNPHRSVCCGDVFCKSELKEGNCPLLECHNKKLDTTTYEDKALQREIKELISYCPNKNLNGCGWTGEIARVDDHLRGCEISCSKCKQIIYFSTMKSHLDTECPCYCPYCDITAEREVISSEHKEKCHKFPLTCPNNCGLDNIPRDDMDEHKKECPLEVIQCEYHCGAMIARDEVIEHDMRNILVHLQSFKTKLDRSFQNATNVVECYNETESNAASFLSSITEELDDITFKFMDHRVKSFTPPCAELQPSEIFRTFLYIDSLFQYGASLLVILGCSLALMLVLLNEQENSPVMTEMDERLSQTLSTLIFNYGFIEQPPSDCDLKCQLEHWENIDQIQIIAPMVLEMPDFDKHRNNNVEWLSGPFFAFEGGYVMRLSVHAAGYGDGEGTHLSVFLLLMKGPHDDKLEWPMRGQYAINLIYPNDSSHNAYKPFVENVCFDETCKDCNRIIVGNMASVGQGYSQYISNEMLSNLTAASSFLTKRNSLLFMISYYDVCDRICSVL